MIPATDRANFANLRTIGPARSKQDIDLLLEFGDKFQGQNIPDAYNSAEKDFEHTLEMIEDDCEGFVELLKRMNQRLE